MNDYEEYIAKSRYARYLDKEKRRETWPETVDRYCDYLINHVETKLDLSKRDLAELKRLLK